MRIKPIILCLTPRLDADFKQFFKFRNRPLDESSGVLKNIDPIVA